MWEPRPGGGEYVTEYQYNTLNKLTKVLMTRNGFVNGTAQQVTQQRQFIYDNNQRLYQTIFPASSRRRPMPRGRGSRTNTLPTSG